MSLDERIERVLEVGEECTTEEELRTLLKQNPNPTAYDGFEPSGRMHIGQGLMKSINVNKLTSEGVKCTFWIADWFAMLNDKMGADMKKIKKIGEYMTEVWKAAGMNMDMVEFRWASDEINARPDEYWMLVMDIARKFSVKRIKRCGETMGREESAKMPAAQIMYPCMQCADIIFLKADICQLGMDQHEVNMLAREYLEFEDVQKKNYVKPVILSHHMLLGLKEGQAKMSTSNPDSAIFMEDSAADVKRKIKQAFCPPGIVYKTIEEKKEEGKEQKTPAKKVFFNPCMDYAKHIVFPKAGKLFISRPDEWGGNKEYTSYEELEADYLADKLHPGDLKPALTKAINEMLEPVRQHFKKGKPAQLLKQIKTFKIKK